MVVGNEAGHLLAHRLQSSRLVPFHAGIPMSPNSQRRTLMPMPAALPPMLELPGAIDVPTRGRSSETASSSHSIPSGPPQLELSRETSGSLTSQNDNEWQMVLYHDRNIVLYNSTENLIRLQSLPPPPDGAGVNLSNSFSRCPVCRQPVDARFAFIAQAYFAILQGLHRQNMQAAAASHYESHTEHQWPPQTAERLTDPAENPFIPSVNSHGQPESEEAAALEALRNVPAGLLNTGYYARFFLETRKLGSGSFGTVHLCRHVLDDLTLGDYAVKKVPVGDSRDWLRSMIQEVKTFERLNHPNIVDYKHSWLELSRNSPFCPYVPFLFILMQFCNAGSLEELIWKGSPQGGSIKALLPNLQVWNLLVDILLGLQHLHHQGILHRDLKPANVLLEQTPDDKWPRALLSDFGTARSLGEAHLLTPSQHGYTGTVEYTAPELLRSSREYSEKSDMWSLGIVLYAMCYGVLPFQHDDPKVLKSMLLQFCEEGGVAVPLPSDDRAQRGSLRLVTSALLTIDSALRPSTDNLMENPVFRNEAFCQTAHCSSWPSEARAPGSEARPARPLNRLGSGSEAPIPLALSSSSCHSEPRALLPLANGFSPRVDRPGTAERIRPLSRTSTTTNDPRSSWMELEEMPSPENTPCAVSSALALWPALPPPSSAPSPPSPH